MLSVSTIATLTTNTLIETIYTLHSKELGATVNQFENLSSQEQSNIYSAIYRHKVPQKTNLSLTTTFCKSNPGELKVLTDK